MKFLLSLIKEICKLCYDVVDLAATGLKERGIGEEVFLNPLYGRVKNHTNPGKNIISVMHNNGSIETIINEYGKLTNNI